MIAGLVRPHFKAAISLVMLMALVLVLTGFSGSPQSSDDAFSGPPNVAATTSTDTPSVAITSDFGERGRGTYGLPGGTGPGRNMGVHAIGSVIKAPDTPPDLDPRPTPQNSPATGNRIIYGVAKVGKWLAVNLSRIEDTDGLESATFEYQWIRSDGSTDQDIPGATGERYTLVSEDVDKTIKVRVSFTDDAGNREELTSRPTPVVEPNNPATGSLTIEGTPRVGETLTANVSGITDADGMETVFRTSPGGELRLRDNIVWCAKYDHDTPGCQYRGANFVAATLVTTYDISPALVGKAINITWRFQDDLGTWEWFGSAPTPKVAATVPDPPQNLEVSIGGEGALELSWEEPTWDSDSFSSHGALGDGGSPITGYKVQWKKASDSWDAPEDVSEETVTGTTHTITGLTGGGYTVRVFASNEIGDSLASNEASDTPEGSALPQPPPPTSTPPQQPPLGGGSGGGNNGGSSGSSVSPSLPTIVAPTLSEGTNAYRSIAENTPAGEDIGDPVAASGNPLIFGLEGDDAASFDIVPATGQLKTKTDLDYETKASYVVTLTATNPSGASSTTAVTINVNNVDEPGTITFSSHQLVVGTEISAVLADPDGAITGTTWLWEKSSDKIVWSAIGGAQSATYTPGQGDAGHHMRVTARYADEQGPSKATSAPSEQAVQDLRIPTGLRAEPGDKPGEAVLKWTPAADAIAHWVQSTKDDGTSAKWTIAQPSMAVVDDLEPGRTYRFRVLEALPPEESSSEWYELSGWVEMHLPALRQPMGLSAQSGNNAGEVVLTWTPAFYAMAQWVWSIRDDGTDGKWTAGEPGKAVVGDLQPGQTYHFAVLEPVEQEDGSSVWSAPSNWADAEPLE